MKDFAFQFLPGDYLRDTQCLSEKAQVAYDRIMCEHVRSISLDVHAVCLAKDRVEFFLKRLSDDEKWEVMSVLNQVSGGFQIEWVAQKVAERAAFLASRAANASGERSSKPKEKHEKGYAKHLDNDNNKDNSNKENSLNNEITEVISYLNEFAGSHFRVTKSHAGHIRARLSEGMTVQDLKDIVVVMVRQWKGTKFEKFLRPSTLFNSEKADGYLSEAKKARNGHVVHRVEVPGMKNSNLEAEVKALLSKNHINAINS